MSLWNHALALLDRVSAPRSVSAHCDVPCGIYDPKAAQVAAETVLTMVTKMEALPMPGPGASQADMLAFANTIGRMVATKEEHAEKVKREIQILWSDYFKPPHLEMFPDLHTHVWNTLKKASQCKQEVNLQAAQELQAMVNQVADWFWESKK